MKTKCRLIAALMMGCLLVSCSSAGQQAASSPSGSDNVNNGFVAAPPTVAAQTPAPREEEPEDLENMPLDPDYDFDVDAMTPADFGDFFTAEYPCDVSEYALLPGSSWQNEVTVIRGAEDGPIVYVVAGVHGDEEAAWQTGKLLKKISIKAGTLYILAPANKWGAQKLPKSRFLDKKDLNRSFPGNPSGTAAQQVAYAIYHDIKAKQPVFVFDLHEASVVQEGRDYLGSSLIFTDVTLFDELFFDLLWATEDGEVCSRPFNYYSPGPDGSVNNTVTKGLGIPAMTVETFRGYPMENRISDQLDIVQYVLHYYGMV